MLSFYKTVDRPYLIEIRIRGDTRDICKQLIYDIYHRFKVRGMVRKRPVPHITLFGPFGCRSIRAVIDAIRETGQNYSKLEYAVDGFDYFESRKKFLFITTSSRKNVIYLKIRPSEDLKEFRHLLSKKLQKITDTVNIDYDSKEKFRFHATLAMKDIDRKFDDIWEYLQKYDVSGSAAAYSITLLKMGKIVCEYDLYEKRVLRRRQFGKR
jgi:2'-5' RNA ligase